MLTSSPTLSELIKNLSSLKATMAALNDALASDPTNNDLNETKGNLEEAINLTRELIESTSIEKLKHLEKSVTSDQIMERKLKYEPPVLQMNTLPSEVQQQMTECRGLQAILGNAPAEWAIGQDVEARWSGDSNFHGARVMAATVDYHFLVEFEDYGHTEILSKDDLRKTQTIGSDGYKPTQAPIRRRVDEGALIHKDHLKNF